MKTINIPEIGDKVTLKYGMHVNVPYNTFNKPLLDELKIDLTTVNPGQMCSVYISASDMIIVEKYLIARKGTASSVVIKWNKNKIVVPIKNLNGLYFSKIDSLSSKTIVSIKHYSYWKQRTRGIIQNKVEDLSIHYSIDGVKKVLPAVLERRATNSVDTKSDTHRIISNSNNLIYTETEIFWKHTPKLKASRATVTSFILKAEGLKRKDCLIRARI